MKTSCPLYNEFLNPQVTGKLAILYDYNTLTPNVNSIGPYNVISPRHLHRVYKEKSNEKFYRTKRFVKYYFNISRENRTRHKIHIAVSAQFAMTNLFD